MKKLEIGPHATRRTPDGEDLSTWDTLDNTYDCTYKSQWGRDKLPIEDNTYDWVHASHVLEHLPWWQTIAALKEVHRILVPGGKVTIWVPDAMGIIKTYEENPDKFLELEKDWNCGGMNPTKDPWTFLNARVFWGARPGELGQEQHFHRAMFGFESLCHVLKMSGFLHCIRLKRNREVDPGHGWMEVGVGAKKWR